MIINRAFYREVTQTSFVVTAVFIALYVVISLVTLLSKAASGSLPTQAIFVLLGLQTIKNLGVLLPLAMFIGILMTLSRWYRDSEMTVLAACGIGLLHFLRPVWILASVFGVLVGLVAFYFGPLAATAMNNVKNENVDAYRAGIVPGEFHRSKRDGAIFYVERLGEFGQLFNIFANSPQFGRRGVVVAKSGYEWTDPKSGEQFLVLENGKRYEGIPGKADYKILSYETYAFRIEPRVPQERGKTLDEMPTPALWKTQDREQAAQLQWRLAKPLALFILAPLALVFAYTDARRGRFANLFTATLLYFLYANLLGFGHALLKQGRIDTTVGLWWVHGLLAAFTAYLLWRRSRHKPLLPSFRRARDA